LYLSYSGFKTYGQCPYEYWHKYVNKTSIPPDNGVNALYGSVVGLVFETFYRDRLWRKVDYLDFLQSIVEPCFDKAIRDQRGRVYDWADEKSNYHSREDVVADVRLAIPRGIQTIRKNRLLGSDASAELKLDTQFGNHLIGGRADFVIRRIAPYEDLVILDGKGSKWREKYVDGDPKKSGQRVEGVQLKLYAALYRAKTGIVPDRLGYIFWHFDGTRPEWWTDKYSESFEAMEWISFDNGDLDNTQIEVLAAADRIASSVTSLDKLSGQSKSYDELRQERFPAQAGGHCRLCSYVSKCEAGTKKVAAMSRKPRTPLPDPGVVEPGLSLDDDE